MIIPVVLAGGSGTRLWPLSRELFPKQLLSLTDDHSMLQNTLLRLAGMESIDSPIIVCNEVHRFMAAEQMRSAGINPRSIMLEPVGRNTAPAITVAALKSLEDGDDPVLLVLPADHVIGNIAAYHEAIELGNRFAQDGYLITFGVIPDAPETGYGYIKLGDKLGDSSKVFSIKDFVEKPDYDTACHYVASKDYCWNSGMFMFKASNIIAELEKYEPAMVSVCRSAFEKGMVDLDFFRLDHDSFEKSISESIDYAVMEKTDKGVIIPFNAGWNDLGSWDALWMTGEKDENQNVVMGDVLVSGVKNSYLNAQSRLIAAVGLEDHVVVETGDAVLVAPRSQVQDVKKLVEILREKKRDEAVCHSRVYRPWGDYETVDMSHRFQVKRITVKPGAKLSLQKHYHRAEHWTVVSGTALITRGDDKIMLKEDESTYIPLGMIHRIENPGKIPLELIEVQSGSYLGEDDIVRFDDVYGRHGE